MQGMSWIDKLRDKFTYDQSYIMVVPLAMAFAIFITLSNIKTYQVNEYFGFYLVGSAFIFPLNYVLGNISTEVYGFKWTRFFSYSAVITHFFALAVIALFVGKEATEFWKMDDYAVIFRAIARTLIGSFSYLSAQYFNAVVISVLKKKTRGRHLWLRVLLSTFIAGTVDAIIFVPIIFYDRIPGSLLVPLAVTSVGFKVLYEAVMLPFTYLAVGFLKKLERVDVFDLNTKYTPFGAGLGYTDEELHRKD